MASPPFPFPFNDAPPIRFIELTIRNGKKVLVNVNEIVTVRTWEDFQNGISAGIELRKNGTLLVLEMYADIVAMLGGEAVQNV